MYLSNKLEKKNTNPSIETIVPTLDKNIFTDDIEIFSHTNVRPCTRNVPGTLMCKVASLNTNQRKRELSKPKCTGNEERYDLSELLFSEDLVYDHISEFLMDESEPRKKRAKTLPIKKLMKDNNTVLPNRKNSITPWGNDFPIPKNVRMTEKKEIFVPPHKGATEKPWKDLDGDQRLVKFINLLTSNNDLFINRSQAIDLTRGEKKRPNETYDEFLVSENFDPWQIGAYTPINH